VTVTKVVTADASQTHDAGFVRVVAVGASAGGLDALTQLLGQLPADTGLAYVLVQHLDPAHESILAELLARATIIPVMQATDGLRIEADHAYVIPPGVQMTLADGHLRLVPRDRTGGPARSIDVFFRSVADVHGSDAVGVVLSGTGSDGALGLEAIKGVGGMTFAQNPASAGYDGMPRAAAATGCVDFVLPPADIATHLARIGHPAGNGWARRCSAGDRSSRNGASSDGAARCDATAHRASGYCAADHRASSYRASGYSATRDTFAIRADRW